jgi:hypothetical protein
MAQALEPAGPGDIPVAGFSAMPHKIRFNPNHGIHWSQAERQIDPLLSPSVEVAESE